MNEKLLSIQFVSKVTGINPHTIRAWEKRYTAVVPVRDDNGRRQYRESDLERLDLLHRLVRAGNNISEIAKLETNQLISLCNTYKLEDQVSQSSTKEEVIDHIKILSNLILALRSYRLDIISHELSKLSSSIDPRDFALKILMPLIQEVGTQVDNKFLQIAQEHALSSLLRFHTGRVLSEYISKSKKNSSKRIIICTPEQERHEFGILIGALLCLHYKFDFYYLGVDLPQESLIDAIDQLKPQFVLIGSSIQMTRNNFPLLRDYVSSVHSIIDEDIKLIIGGSPSFETGSKAHNLIFLPSLQSLDNYLDNI